MTEQERCEIIKGLLRTEIDALRKELEVQSYWGMRWEKEHEINISLRKELEQVKELHKDALILLEQEECRHDETKEKLEQVKMREAEIIAQAKEEQREADAKVCLRQDGMHDHIYAEAIRNNKE